MAATKARRSEPPAVAPVFGNYRCYLNHPKFAGRPCNKWLRAGTGPWAGRCGRCGGDVHFPNPNEPIR